MSDYLDYITDVNEDLKTETVIDLKLKVTCNQIKNLEFKALDAGFKSSSDLIEAFIGDLTGWGVTNGSDERHHAEQWYERAFGIWTAENYYFRTYLFLNNHSYSMEDMVNSMEMGMDSPEICVYKGLLVVFVRYWQYLLLSL